MRSTVARPVLLGSEADMGLAAVDRLHLEGTQAKARGHLRLVAGKDVLIESAQSRFAQGQSSSHHEAGLGLEAHAGASGASAGVSVSGAYGNSRSHAQETRQLNAQLLAGEGITLRSSGNAALAGAVVAAPEVELAIGGDLHVASRQDIGTGSQRSRNVSGNAFFGIGSPSSIGLTAGAGEGKTSKAWVEEPTAIVAGERLSIDVEGHTQLDGALLAANDNLRLETSTLGFSDILDHDESHYTSANVGFNSAAIGGVLKGASASGEIANRNREQVTRATISDGEIIVREGEADIAALNRDPATAQQITRNEASGVSFYASTSAIEEATSSFEGIQQNVQTLERGIIDGSLSVPGVVRDLIASGEMGLDEFAQLVGIVEKYDPRADLPLEGGSEVMAFAPVVVLAAAESCVASPACLAIVAALATHGWQKTKALVQESNEHPEQPGLTVSTPAHENGPTTVSTPPQEQKPQTVSTPVQEQGPTVLAAPVDPKTGEPIVLVTKAPDYQFPLVLESNKGGQKAQVSSYAPELKINSPYGTVKDINVDELKFTKTVANHLNDINKLGGKVRPYGDSKSLIHEIISSKDPYSDPRGVPGALRWDVQGKMNGSDGTYELVIDKRTHTVLHFLFKSGK